MEFTLEFLRIFVIDLLYAWPILGCLLLLICLIGLVIGRIERWSLFDSFYHAFINATTVGYGDFRPAHKPAKMLAIVLAFVGLVFTGMVVAIALHAATDAFKYVHDIKSFGNR